VELACRVGQAAFGGRGRQQGHHLQRRHGKDRPARPDSGRAAKYGVHRLLTPALSCLVLVWTTPRACVSVVLVRHLTTRTTAGSGRR